MKTALLGIRIFLFYVLFFLIGRGCFYAFNLTSISDLNIGLFLKASLHGIQMDMSMAGYITVLNALVIAVFSIAKSSRLTLVLRWLNVLLFAPLSVFLIINARLYTYWGFHIDRSILEYLKTPKEAFASANITDWLLVVVAACLFGFVLFRLFKVIVIQHAEKLVMKRSGALWSIVLMAVMIIPIRGGFDVATMSISTVYFSSDPFENHLAVNPVWNAGFSLTEPEVQTFRFLDDSAKTEAYRSVYSDKTVVTDVQFDSNVNVVFIVLESFTANVISSIGGIEGITPNLNKWMQTGMSFENCYASGDRSDKGLTTLFTGFPALPNARLLSHPNKLLKVPKLNEAFKESGYATSFYYGGNLNFANLKLLFSDGNVDKIVTGKDFSAENTGKWGVRDGDMFSRFYGDLQESSQPFFATLYTLSSHEPFDIPAVSYTSDTLTSDFYKAIYYTDSCFGSFMNQLSQSALWDNTIVVVTADHGVKNPGNLVLLSPRKFRVPLLITGGAVQHKRRYTQFCSHTDIPFSLEESVLGQKTTHYPFSKSVFDTTSSNAFYYYVMGAGSINENGCVVYDIKGDVFLVNTTQIDSVGEAMKQQLLGVTQEASERFSKY